MSDAPKKMVSQAGQPFVYGGFQFCEPLKQGLQIERCQPVTGIANGIVFDCDNGAIVETAQICAVLPDAGVYYMIDEIVLTAVKAFAKGAGAAPTVLMTATSGAAATTNLIDTGTIADALVNAEISTGNALLTWHADSDTEAERTICGPVTFKITTTAAAAAAATGQFVAHVRYHVAKPCGQKYPSLSTETDA